MKHITITRTEEVEVTHLRAECGVRYWEDATVNGVEDTDGTLIPCRMGDAWCPMIALEDGKIRGWPQGKTASLHYKVCDDGRYSLLSPSGETVAEIDGYVPEIMAPSGGSYGDYVIMEISEDGIIQGWGCDLTPWEQDEGEP